MLKSILKVQHFYMYMKSCSQTTSHEKYRMIRKSHFLSTYTFGTHEQSCHTDLPTRVHGVHTLVTLHTLKVTKRVSLNHHISESFQFQYVQKTSSTIRCCLQTGVDFYVTTLNLCVLTAWFSNIIIKPAFDVSHKTPTDVV